MSVKPTPARTAVIRSMICYLQDNANIIYFQVIALVNRSESRKTHHMWIQCALTRQQTRLG